MMDTRASPTTQSSLVPLPPGTLILIPRGALGLSASAVTDLNGHPTLTPSQACGWQHTQHLPDPPAPPHPRPPSHSPLRLSNKLRRRSSSGNVPPFASLSQAPAIHKSVTRGHSTSPSRQAAQSTYPAPTPPCTQFLRLTAARITAGTPSPAGGRPHPRHLQTGQPAGPPRPPASADPQNAVLQARDHPPQLHSPEHPFRCPLSRQPSALGVRLLN